MTKDFFGRIQDKNGSMIIPSTPSKIAEEKLILSITEISKIYEKDFYEATKPLEEALYFYFYDSNEIWNNKDFLEWLKAKVIEEIDLMSLKEFDDNTDYKTFSISMERIIECLYEKCLEKVRGKV